MKILFVSSVSVVAPNPSESRKLYIDALGLPLEQADGDEYYFSEKVGGSKHFGIWPLSQAAEACFGTKEWPADVPVPQVSLEFEVADEQALREAEEELKAKGFALLHPTRTEPWGQTVVRLLSSEGSIVGVSYAPWLHDESGKE